MVRSSVASTPPLLVCLEAPLIMYLFVNNACQYMYVSMGDLLICLFCLFCSKSSEKGILSKKKKKKEKKKKTTTKTGIKTADRTVLFSLYMRNNGCDIPHATAAG